MQALRHAHLTARIVLAWFLLALGVAVASPVLHPQSIALVCTSAGVVQLRLGGDAAQPRVGSQGSPANDDSAVLAANASGTGGVSSPDGTAAKASHTLDCPLCVHLAAPPPVAQVQLPVVHPLAHALQPIAAAHIAARTASPLPPRGPPRFS